MNFKQLNEVLKDIPALRSKRVERTVEHEVDGESQGDEGVAYEVCPLPYDGLYVRLRITTDSYGDNESVSGIEFVQPIEKQITRYEPVN